jgi:serine/threonine protein kinase
LEGLFEFFSALVFFFNLIPSSFQVTLKETKEEYSMKILPRKLVAEEKLMENLILERSVMMEIGSRHPFIAGLYFSFTSLHSYHLVMPPQSRGSLFTLLRNRAQVCFFDISFDTIWSDRDRWCVYFYFEKLIRKFQPFTEKQAKFYAAEVILGLKALHQQNYVYRGLNFLFRAIS